MKSLKIISKKLEEKGVKEAEKVILLVYKAIEESCPEIVVDAETSAMEKSFAGIALPVLASLESAVSKLADLNKDGQVG